MATVDDKKIIFSMVGVSKTIQQNQKQILKNIYLSFYYGAKIGIIGLNGAGKSTLMKIIAGLETQYQGQVVFAPGYSVGYLPQDPQLDPTKTVKEVVQEGVQHVVDTLKEFEDINLKFGMPEYYEDPEKMDKLFARQAELQDIIDATDAWNLDSRLERAMDAHASESDLKIIATYFMMCIDMVKKNLAAAQFKVDNYIEEKFLIKDNEILYCPIYETSTDLSYSIYIITHFQVLILSPHLKVPCIHPLQEPDPIVMHPLTVASDIPRFSRSTVPYVLSGDISPRKL